MLEEREEETTTSEAVSLGLEEKENEPTTTQEMNTELAERREEPVAAEEGPASAELEESQYSTTEVSFKESQKPQGKIQEENRGTEHPPEVYYGIRKKTPKRRITSYLSNISKHVEKNGNQINKITTMLQSLQKQGRSKPTTGAIAGRDQSKSIRQIQSEISQLLKQVTRVQKDIERIRTGSATKTKSRKSTPSKVKPRSKKNKSVKKSKLSKKRRNT